MSARIFIVVCEDRHCDPAITVHRTRDGADRRVEAFMREYGDDYQWFEGQPVGNGDDGPREVPGDWLRYVETDMPDDGPSARIEKGTLRR